MRLPRPQPRPRGDDYLIPLINVVFLMLIFFMIAGRITAPEPLQVEPPSARHGHAAEPDPVLLLIDAEGRIALEGERVSAEALGERLRTGVGAFREAGAGAAPGERTPPVTVKADARLDMGRLRAVLAQLRASGIERIELRARRDAY